MSRSRFWLGNSSRERTPRQPARERRGRDTGRDHRTLYSLATLTVLAGVAVLPLGAASGAAASGVPASDSCTATISVPSISITQSSPGMFLWVQGTLTRACNSSDAKWDAYSGTQKGGSWDFAGTPTANWPLPYGSGPVGHYAALPAGAVDGAGNPVPQAQAGFAIKFGSRTQIKGYHSGGYVHLRAHVSRFNWSLNGGYGAWQPSVNRNVDFYEQSHGAWARIGSLATGTDGWTRSMRVRAPDTHNFYAHVIQTTTIWGARSRTIDR
jgi:hypothetical protein